MHKNAKSYDTRINRHLKVKEERRERIKDIYNKYFRLKLSYREDMFKTKLFDLIDLIPMDLNSTPHRNTIIRAIMIT